MDDFLISVEDKNLGILLEEFFAIRGEKDFIILCEFVKSTMAQKGLTEEGLAEMTGLPLESVKHIELKIPFMDIHSLSKVLKALDLKIKLQIDI